MSEPTERDFDLMEVALESAAESIQSGVIIRGGKAADPLAVEYLHALDAVRAWRNRVERG